MTPWWKWPEDRRTGTVAWYVTARRLMFLPIFAFGVAVANVSEKWRPIAEYSADLGPVIVWLEWPTYCQVSRAPEHSGTFEHAYLLALSNGAVWVQAKDQTPIESGGRRVTHFMRPARPEPTT